MDVKGLKMAVISKCEIVDRVVSLSEDLRHLDAAVLYIGLHLTVNIDLRFDFEICVAV